MEKYLPIRLDLNIMFGSEEKKENIKDTEIELVAALLGKLAYKIKNIILILENETDDLLVNKFIEYCNFYDVLTCNEKNYEELKSELKNNKWESQSDSVNFDEELILKSPESLSNDAMLLSSIEDLLNYLCEKIPEYSNSIFESLAGYTGYLKRVKEVRSFFDNLKNATDREIELITSKLGAKLDFYTFLMKIEEQEEYDLFINSHQDRKRRKTTRFISSPKNISLFEINKMVNDIRSKYIDVSEQFDNIFIANYIQFFRNGKLSNNLSQKNRYILENYLDNFRHIISFKSNKYLIQISDLKEDLDLFSLANKNMSKESSHLNQDSLSEFLRELNEKRLINCRTLIGKTRAYALLSSQAEFVNLFNEESNLRGISIHYTYFSVLKAFSSHTVNNWIEVVEKENQKSLKDILNQEKFSNLIARELEQNSLKNLNYNDIENLLKYLEKDNKIRIIKLLKTTMKLDEFANLLQRVDFNITEFVSKNELKHIQFSALENYNDYCKRSSNPAPKSILPVKLNRELKKQMFKSIITAYTERSLYRYYDTFIANIAKAEKVNITMSDLRQIKSQINSSNTDDKNLYKYVIRKFIDKGLVKLDEAVTASEIAVKNEIIKNLTISELNELISNDVITSIPGFIFEDKLESCEDLTLLKLLLTNAISKNVSICWYEEGKMIGYNNFDNDYKKNILTKKI